MIIKQKSNLSSRKNVSSDNLGVLQSSAGKSNGGEKEGDPKPIGSHKVSTLNVEIQDGSIADGNVPLIVSI